MTSSWSSGRNASLIEMHILFCNAQIAKNLSLVKFRPCMEKDLTPRFRSHIFCHSTASGVCPAGNGRPGSAGAAQVYLVHGQVLSRSHVGVSTFRNFSACCSTKMFVRFCVTEFVKWLINCMYNDSQRPTLRCSSDGVRFGRWCDEWRCNV